MSQHLCVCARTRAQVCRETCLLSADSLPLLLQPNSSYAEQSHDIRGWSIGIFFSCLPTELCLRNESLPVPVLSASPHPQLFYCQPQFPLPLKVPTAPKRTPFTCPGSAAFDPENRSWALGAPQTTPRSPVLVMRWMSMVGGRWLLSTVDGDQTHPSISCSSPSIFLWGGRQGSWDF